MINLEFMLSTVVNGLEAELKTRHAGCKVVMANQNAPIPDYPYVSFIITSITENSGTWGHEDDGSHTKPVRQTWSFTTQAETQMESYVLASTIKDWFELRGIVYLSDNGIAVERVRDVTSRDNLITTDYEYRYGLDVVLSIMDTAEVESEYIEIADIKEV